MATVIIQARLGSARFPKKVLYPLPNGKRIIDTVIDAAKGSRAENVVLVTPDAELSSEVDIPVYIWDKPRDVLAEFYHAAKDYQDDIIRITADCPLMTSRIIDMTLDEYQYRKLDYVYNSHDDEGGQHDGFDVEIFSFAALKEAYEKATDPYEREHVTPYIRKHFRCGYYDMNEGRSVNTYEDYLEVCRIMEKHYDCSRGRVGVKLGELRESGC